MPGLGDVVVPQSDYDQYQDEQSTRSMTDWADGVAQADQMHAWAGQVAEQDQMAATQQAAHRAATQAATRTYDQATDGVDQMTAWADQLAAKDRAPATGGDEASHLQRVYQDARANGLDDDAANAAVAVARTEKGYGGAQGDQAIGGSRGTFQFYAKGELPNYAASRGLTLEQADAELAADPHAGNQFALSGYLGRAIREGQAKGLTGPALAEYAQRYGQRSEAPERAAANYGPIQGGGQTDVLGPAPSPRADRVEALGQFEQGLPYDEAAAICGPVAAVAFAQANGRNPDLGEARRLAAQVGWTTAGGMNGVANEQKLLTAMGVASRLDTNPDFGHIAQDAASGNPVIISTDRHYYFASAYDPDTGKLYVGKTGTSRRGGGSWMTPQEIATLDGGINGALFVDNPQSPTPSVGADPMASGEGDRPASEFETPPPEEIPRRLGPESIAPTDLSRIGIDVPVPGPSEIRSAALTGANAVGAGIDAAGDAVWNQVKGFNADQQELQDLSLRQFQAARRGESLPPAEEQRLADLSAQYGLVMTGEPIQAVNQAGRAALGLERAATAERQPGMSINPTGSAPPAERAAMPAVDQILKQWDPGAQPGGPGLAQKLEDARTFLVRKMTDRRVDVNQAQAEVQRLYGRDLPPDMQLSELSRMNPTGAATLRAQNDVAPALRAAGDDLPYVQALLAARGNVDVAAAKGAGRAFPGGATAASSADVPAQLAQTLGPQRFKIVSDAADRIVKVNQDLRQMLVDSGRITQQTANEWATTYPNYTPTQIVDYLAEQSGVPAGGQGKSLGVRGGAIHALSEAGTERARLSPIASTINNIYTVENLAKQQATFNALRNWVERVPEMANRFQVVDGAYAGTRAESAVKGYVDGQLKSIVTPFPEMARILRQEPTQTVPIIGPMMQAVKELITARNPAFLVGNAMMDFPVYLIRETAKASGMPQDTARAIGRYAAAIPDAFAGLLSGEFKGPATQRYLAQGGSMEAWAQHVRSPADAERYVQELRRSGGIHISSVGDLMAASKALLTGQTFKTIGERVELVPRVAAFRAGEQAGLSPARAVTRGRDVTVDFAEGGTWAKTLNQLIPFFNPAVQGGANLARTVYQNPRGAGMTFALGLVAPTLAVEAWNRSDPERSAAYDDVPNYVKDRGIVFMLPGPGGQGVLTTQDAQGNRKPQYLALNLREFAPVVDATRAAGDVAFGREHRSWSDLLLGAAQQVAPTADVGSATPLGARSLLELGVNKDLYRGTAIATQNADERASILSKALAQGINDVAAKAGLYPNVRPSQAEFLQRENLGVLAQASGGVSDVLTGATRGSTNPQDLPVAGAFLRRVVGNATGQGLENAREGRLDPDVRKTLYDTGLAADVTTVPRDIKGITLLQADQTAYQTRANQHVNDSLRRVLDDPGFASLPPDVKKRVVQNVVQGAKQVAAGETLAALGADEVRRRAATAKKAG